MYYVKNSLQLDSLLRELHCKASETVSSCHLKWHLSDDSGSEVSKDTYLNHTAKVPHIVSLCFH